jgi:hypothetical protein
MADARRPVNWEAWSERQIREATERGDFADLPGAGKPIPDIDRPHDEMWWVRDKLRREHVSYLPPSLAARKEAEDALDAARHARSEAEARRIIEALNGRIRALLRIPPAGPPLNLMPADVERVAAEWRALHPPAPAGRATEPAAADGAVRRSWWRRPRRDT